MSEADSIRKRMRALLERRPDLEPAQICAHTVLAKSTCNRFLAGEDFGPRVHGEFERVLRRVEEGDILQAGQDPITIKPYIARVIGTNDGKSEARAWVQVDWAFREYLPLYLDTLEGTLASECAAGLRGLNQITPATGKPIDTHKAAIADLTLQLQTFYMANHKELERDGRKSVRLAYGVIGRRLGQPTLKMSRLRKWPALCVSGGNKMAVCSRLVTFCKTTLT